MRVSEIIRSILDIIDSEQPTKVNQPINVPNEDFYDDDIRRFRQIVDLQDQGTPTQYSNTPKEEYADVDAVTTAAGGGPNKPKHASDIRGNSFRIYPSDRRIAGDQ